MLLGLHTLCAHLCTNRAQACQLAEENTTRGHLQKQTGRQRRRRRNLHTTSVSRETKGVEKNKWVSATGQHVRKFVANMPQSHKVLDARP